MKHPASILALAALIFAAPLAAQDLPQPPRGMTRTPTRTPAIPSPAGRPTAPGRLPAGARPGGAAAPAAAPTAVDIDAQIAEAEKSANGRTKLTFYDAPADLFLQLYGRTTNRTLLTAPDVPKVNVTMRSINDESWTEAQYLQAIETQLQLVGIELIPVGEQFLLVVPFKTGGQYGMKTFLELPESGHHPEEGKIIRQMITPKNIGADEAQKVLETLKRPDGQLQYLERTNSLLVTDTQENINRMIDILAFIDKALPVQEDVYVRTIQHAKVEDIKAKLEEFVAESQKQDEAAKKSIAAPQVNRSGPPGMSQSVSRTVNTRLPGVTRSQDPEPAAPSGSMDALVSDADRGMIRGKVQIMADTRSNKMIIVTRKNNMMFFDRVIEELDVATAPDVTVEIVRLQYALAETKDGHKGISDLLNELIDNASAKKEDATRATANVAARNANLTAAGGSSAPAPAPSPEARTASAGLSGSAKSKLGELNKENIKILPDPRINALLIMASPSDLSAIKEIIKEMDIEVAQVMIETVVLEVALSDSFQAGIEWVKHIDPNDPNQRNPWIASGGGTTGAQPMNLINSILNGATNLYPVVKSGVSYMATFESLNLDVVIEASKSDGRTKILSSPVLLTQDNKEAEIKATELRYMYNGKKYVGYNTGSVSGGYEDDIQQKEIGLNVKITPRINPDGKVVLTVEEKFEQVVENGQQINNTWWPTVNTRELKSEVAIANGQTLVLGGLVQVKIDNSVTGIPILKDIPWVGPYLFGSVKESETRAELLVFLTPHVFKNADEAQKEAKRRKDYLNVPGVWTEGWSSSPLADPMNQAELKRRLETALLLQKEQIEGQANREKMMKQYEEQRRKLEEKNPSSQPAAPGSAPAEALLTEMPPKENRQ